MADLTTWTMIGLRWIHFVAGITWIGLLYFFNLVNVPWQKQLDGATKGKVVPTLMPRALWWFRWGATITVLAGILLLDQMARPQGWTVFAGTEQGRTILLGGFLGLVMWFNVWFIIWPNQRKVIAATENTAATGAAAPPEQPKWGRTSFLASRTNFVLSFPMLAMMGASGHLGSFQDALMLGVVVTVGALIWVWYLGQPKKAPAAAPLPPVPAPPPSGESSMPPMK